MNLDRLHRRLVVAMAMAALLAFAGGAGFEPVAATIAALTLIGALFWQPSRQLSLRLEQIWLPLAMLLVVRALYHVFLVGDDVVIPVVDLLLLLLGAEALRSLDAANDGRMYALSFALLLAATAYRPGILFALAFVSYVALATVALMVGYLRREAERHGLNGLPIGRGFLAATAALSGVTLAMSAVVFLTFPRVSRGWAGRGNPVSTSVAGFSDQVSIGEFGSTIFGNPQIVLRVEFPDSLPRNTGSLHWRGRSYDRFDGVRWTKSRNLPPSTAPTTWYTKKWEGGRVRQEIYGTALDVRVLFALHPVVDVDAQARIQPIFDNSGDFSYWGSAAPAYTAWSMGRQPAPDSLRAARRGYTPSRTHYTQMPQLPGRVQTLADSLTRGYDNNYDKAMAIQQWFHREFAYTRELPRTSRQTSLDYFLFERKAGHCEYFSTGMIVLLRSVGIVAREVNGFLGGQWSDFGQYLAVTQNEAHSWVEVWFPAYGWVSFDPTPPGSAGSVSATSMFWPGRFLLDGMQHRWNKWVLDYSLTKQSDLLQRTAGLFGANPDSTGSSDTGGGPNPVWLLLLFGLIIVAAAGLARRGRGHFSPESRLYLRLRNLYARNGLPAARTLTPLALSRRLSAEDRPGAAPASLLIGLYLQARFSGATDDEQVRREMSAALKATRRDIRRRSNGS